MRLRHACPLRRHARHDFRSEECTSEREENCFDFRLMSEIAMFRQWSEAQSGHHLDARGQMCCLTGNKG